MTDTETKLEYKAWLLELEAVFAKAPGMTEEDAHSYVADNAIGWRDYYDDDFSPADAASEDMSYWD